MGRGRRLLTVSLWARRWLRQSRQPPWGKEQRPTGIGVPTEEPVTVLVSSSESCSEAARQRPPTPLPTLTQIKRPSEGRRLAQDSRAKQRSMENPSLSTPPPFSPGSRMQLRPTFGSTKGPQLHPETVRPSLPAAAIRCRILPSRLFCTQPFTTSLRQQKNCGLTISCWEHR